MKYHKLLLLQEFTKEQLSLLDQDMCVYCKSKIRFMKGSQSEHNYAKNGVRQTYYSNYECGNCGLVYRICWKAAPTKKWSWAAAEAEIL